MCAKPKIKIKTKGTAKPVKAGSTHPHNVGGVLNYKVLRIRKKIKNG